VSFAAKHLEGKKKKCNFFYIEIKDFYSFKLIHRYNTNLKKLKTKKDKIVNKFKAFILIA